MGLVKTFTLYARMPRSYWSEIKIAEQLNEEGNKKFEELIKIYQKEYTLFYSTSKTVHIQNPGEVQWLAYFRQLAQRYKALLLICLVG